MKNKNNLRLIVWFILAGLIVFIIFLQFILKLESGSTADWVSGIGSLVALIFAYWQIVESKYQTQKSIEEMKKEHEDSVKPDIYVKDNLTKLITQNSKIDDFSLKITNIGKDVAKDIVIEKYTDDDIKKIREIFKDATDIQINVHDDWVTFIELNDDDTVKHSYRDYKIDDKNSILFAKDEIDICFPEIYIGAILRQLKRMHNIDNVIETFPSLHITIKYKDLMNKSYTKRIKLESFVPELKINNNKMEFAVIHIKSSIILDKINIEE